MNYSEALSWLDSLQGSGIRPGLGRVKAILRAAGNPQRFCPSIIVAGTNGKGSTAATLASILDTSGYRAGLYTSPHLIDVRERWRAGGANVSENDLADTTKELQDASSAVGILPTYFEALTVVAFLLFRRLCCDVSVLEVGMGGRLDATNVVSPIAAAITSISFDHTEFLGTTIRSIAREKAGVIHRGAAVVTSNSDPVILEVLRRRAGLFGTELHILDRETEVSSFLLQENGSSFILRTPQASYRLTSTLAGVHQTTNIGLAVRAAELIAPVLSRITPDSIEEGVRRARWRGRLERFEIRGKLVYVDGAHNPDAAARLASFVSEQLPVPRALVFGALADKDFAGMAGNLFGLFQTIVLTQPETERALPATKLQPLAMASGAETVIREEPVMALEQALASNARAVVVCGSLYLAGSAIEYLDRITAVSESTMSVAESSTQNETS